MSSTTFCYIRIVLKSAVFLGILVIGTHLVEGQDKIKFGLSTGYGTQGGGSYQYLVKPDTPLIFNWSISIEDYVNFTNGMEGKLSVVLSIDTVFDEKDLQLVHRSYQVTNYDYQKDTVRQALSPGEYFLLANFSATDTVRFRRQSNTIRQRVMVYELNFNPQDAFIADFEVSE